MLAAVVYASFSLLFNSLVTQANGQSFSTSPTATGPTDVETAPTTTQDLVDFTTITAWPNLKFCLKDQLQLYQGGVAAWIDCNSNACLCNEKFAQAEDKLASDALQECSYESDMQSATSILSEYCSQRGYKDLKGATSLNTHGIVTLPYPTDSDSRSTETPDDPSSSEGEGRHLDFQSIIGIVFGILGFFVGIAAVWFAFKMWEAHQRNSAAAVSHGDPASKDDQKVETDTKAVQTAEGVQDEAQV